MSKQAGQSDDDDSEYRDDGEDEDDEDDVVYNTKGSARKVNKRGRRGNRSAPRNTGVRTPAQDRTVRSGTPSPPEDGPFAPRSSAEQYPPRPSVYPLAEQPPSAAPRSGLEHDSRDELVLDIYESLYHQRPDLDPRRDRSQIPDRSSPPQHPSGPMPAPEVRVHTLFHLITAQTTLHPHFFAFPAVRVKAKNKENAH
jgi:hypothetical protein